MKKDVGGEAKLLRGEKALEERVQVQLTSQGLAVLHSEGTWLWRKSEIDIEHITAELLYVNHRQNGYQLEIHSPSLVKHLSSLNTWSWKLSATPFNIALLAMAVIAVLLGLISSSKPISKLLTDQVSRDKEHDLTTDMWVRLFPMVCSDPEGLAALEELKQRLNVPLLNELDYSLTVVPQEAPNGFAAMGDRVALTKGLLEMAESPEEIAGVLAHEIGHVYHRHVLEQVIRSTFVVAALNFAMGDVSGAIVLDPATMGLIIHLGFSREAESQADQLAGQILKEAGVSASGLVDFFSRIKGRDKSQMRWLSTHPLSTDRIEFFKSIADEQASQELPPLMSQVSWLQLKNICQSQSSNIAIKRSFSSQ